MDLVKRNAEIVALVKALKMPMREIAAGEVVREAQFTRSECAS